MIQYPLVTGFSWEITVLFINKENNWRESAIFPSKTMHIGASRGHFIYYGYHYNSEILLHGIVLSSSYEIEEKYGHMGTSYWWLCCSFNILKHDSITEKLLILLFGVLKMDVRVIFRFVIVFASSSYS